MYHLVMEVFEVLGKYLFTLFCMILIYALQKLSNFCSVKVLPNISNNRTSNTPSIKLFLLIL